MNKVKNCLASRQLSIGSWIQIGHPVVAEILADAGFDWLVVDMEHTDINLEQASNIFRSIESTTTIPLVRVRENDELCIRQVLDQGAKGVVVPLINTAEAATAAVAAAKYPPLGRRGYAFTRACKHGKDFDQYVNVINNEIVIVVMIESIEAVRNIDQILAVVGVDGVLIGPYDLSGSMGIPGELNSPTMSDAMLTVSRAATAAGKSAGLHLVAPTNDAIATAYNMGFTFLALGMDTVFIQQSATAAQTILKQLNQQATNDD